MQSRRKFIKHVAGASAASLIPLSLYPQQKPGQEMIWANLIHLSYNLWHDNIPLKYQDENFTWTECKNEARGWRGYRSSLSFDENTWDVIIKGMVEAGINMVVIDLGDAIKYDSHPEIAVINAWFPGKLKSELTRLRKLGIEPIPKLNFATTHDVWLKQYSRMVSTDIYYGVCRDLINEVSDLFDKPRFFHLGMDEETASAQKNYDYAVIRQKDLWWDDFYFYVEEVEKNGVRPWIWSDYAWQHPELFFRKMPKSVVQSNWYYNDEFNTEKLKKHQKIPVKLYYDLELHGYDQIPTCSNCFLKDENLEETINYCTKEVSPSRLLGFMGASWRPTLAPCLERHIDQINKVARGMRHFYKVEGDFSEKNKLPSKK